MSGKFKKRILVVIVFLLLLPVSYKIYRKNKISKAIYAELAGLHWNLRKFLFEKEKVKMNEIIFLGNSLTERFNIDSIGGKKIINRGISGDFTVGVLDRLPQVTKLRPSKIFLEIGINDLVEQVSPETIVKNIKKITEEIRSESPQTKIYVYSLTPTDLPSGIFRSSDGLNTEVKETNVLLKKMCEENKLTYIDIHTALCGNNRLRPEYSLDGIHFTDAAYEEWKKIVTPFVLE